MTSGNVVRSHAKPTRCRQFNKQPVTDHPQGTQGTGLGPRAFGGPQLQKYV